RRRRIARGAGAPIRRAADVSRRSRVSSRKVYYHRCQYRSGTQSLIGEPLQQGKKFLQFCDDPATLAASRGITSFVIDFDAPTCWSSKVEERLNQKGEIRMKKLMLSMLGFGAIASLAFAGTETYGGKEMKQVAAPLPCPEWYADREFNVSLWGTYAFTGNEWANDRYLEADHAWGGGLDLKYFFARYFGIGVEGWAVDARRAFVIDNDFDNPVPGHNIGHDNRAVGAVLGTLTLR